MAKKSNEMKIKFARNAGGNMTGTVYMYAADKSNCQTFTAVNAASMDVRRLKSEIKETLENLTAKNVAAGWVFCERDEYYNVAEIVKQKLWEKNKAKTSC